MPLSYAYTVNDGKVSYVGSFQDPRDAEAAAAKNPDSKWLVLEFDLNVLSTNFDQSPAFNQAMIQIRNQNSLEPVNQAGYVAKRILASLDLHPYFDPAASMTEITQDGVAIQTIGFKKSPVEDDTLTFHVWTNGPEILFVQAQVLKEKIATSDQIAFTTALDSGLQPIQEFVEENAQFLA